MDTLYLENLAYVIGLAIGDGNLSNPNGRAVKLRITCDLKYPNLVQRIIVALQTLLPTNVVNTIKRPRNCVDVYCYSNKLERLLGWKVGMGPKHFQKVHVPDWIIANKHYTAACLRGLMQTDGSIYNDRGYKMVMFVTVIPELAYDVTQMIQNLGFLAYCYKIKQQKPQLDRYNTRISKMTEQFISSINLIKD